MGIQEIITVGDLKRKLRDISNKTKLRVVIIDDSSLAIRMEGLVDVVSLPDEEHSDVILYAAGEAYIK